MQIIQINQSDEDSSYKIFISDSESWVEVGVDKSYKRFLGNEIKVLDIIELADVSGSLVDGTLFLVS